jgi:hypothetical protein
LDAFNFTQKGTELLERGLIGVQNCHKMGGQGKQTILLSIIQAVNFKRCFFFLNYLLIRRFFSFFFLPFPVPLKCDPSDEELGRGLAYQVSERIDARDEASYQSYHHRPSPNPNSSPTDVASNNVDGGQESPERYRRNKLSPAQQGVQGPDGSPRPVSAASSDLEASQGFRDPPSYAEK